MKTCMHAKSLQSCLTLCGPMDCRLPGSSLHGILQARILEWVAICFSTMRTRGTPNHFSVHEIKAPFMKILGHNLPFYHVAFALPQKWLWLHQFSSVQFSHSVVSDSLRPHELQHDRPPCPSSTPRVHSNPCLLSW